MAIKYTPNRLTGSIFMEPISMLLTLETGPPARRHTCLNC